MPTLSCDPAYSQLLDTNQELHSELRDEISINKSYEKKIRSLVKELEQCYRTISLQDNTIIVHEKVIEKFKSEISDLRKQLRILQQDKKFKDEVGSIQDGRIIELENKVEQLKARIWILTNKKISINALEMATTDLIVNVNRGLDRIENHIRGVGTPIQNPTNVIDGIRGSLNTIRAILQNVTAERDQYQDLLNDENKQIQDLRQQLSDTRNQNLRFQRLLDESQGERDLAILAYNNERDAYRDCQQIAQQRQVRIVSLLQENFAFRLLNQHKDTQIAEHRRIAHRMTVRYNNDTECRRRRHAGCAQQAQNWKGQYRNSQNQVQVRNQNIFNLQQQIFVLQNNPPQVQQIGMAGYPPPRYSGRGDEDLDEHIKNYRLYLTAAGIATNNAQGKQRALALWQSTLTGDASQWRETKIAGKKFRLNHVAVGNNLANMAAVRALNNGLITALLINAPDGTAAPALPVGATGALVIPAHDVHTDEDWSYAGGYAVDVATANNIPNGATNNNNQIVLPDINISQELYLWRTTYTTEVRKQQELIFGHLIQNNLPIREYYRKLCKYARLAQVSDREKRMQFLRGLNPENKLEIKRLGLNRVLDNDLIEALEEIEKEKNEMLLSQNIYNQPTVQKAPVNQGITTADIEKIINARIQALQQEQVHNQGKSQNNEALNYLHSLAERLHAPQDILNSDNISFLNNYINEELARRLGVVEAHFARLGFFKTLSKKEPFFDPQVYAIKKSSRHRTKTKQKKSKNKSKKKKKSKSSRVHIAK